MATTPIYLQNKTTGQRAHLMDDGWMIVLTEPVTDVILTNSAVVQTVSAADWAAYLTHSDLIDANRQALVALSPVFSAVLESVKALTAAVQNMPTVAGGGMTEVQFEQKYAELSSRTVDTTTHTVKPVGTV
jgi:hypothetical protein